MEHQRVASSSSHTHLEVRAWLENVQSKKGDCKVKNRIPSLPPIVHMSLDPNDLTELNEMWDHLGHER